ncbi:MAG: hypothetical protein ACTSYJ_11175 [Candidatus Thorarchaeota archaeon]
MGKKQIFVVTILIAPLFILGLSPSVNAYTFPSGDWWAIDDNHHSAWAIEDMPSEGKVWWRAEFYWTENDWPEDGWDPWPFYVDEWYMHEFRRFEYNNYGDDYDYDVMDFEGTYYTTLPPPHDVEWEERILWPNWFWDPINNDEEVEVYCKEPCDIDTYTTYVARVTFNKHGWYDDYMMVFESEHGNQATSPPDDFEEIERKNYVVPGALNFGTRSGFDSWSFDGSQINVQPIEGAFQGESPVIEVRRSGGMYPYLSTVIQGNYSMKTMISEYAWIHSNSELERFVKMKNEDIRNIDSSQKQVEAIVSFNRLVEMEELLDLVDEFEMEVSWLRYVSSVGGGKISFQEQDDIMQKITLYDSCFKEDYGEDFTFVTGIGAVRAMIPTDIINNLMDDNRVLVIDRGPISVYREIYDSYPNTIIIMKWCDIFQEYMKLLE